jgi:hypothetical protein
MENGAFLESEAAILGAVDIRTGEVGGEQVRGELYAVKITLQAAGKHLDRACLGQARRTLDQQVTIRKQGNQQALDKVPLAQDLGLDMLTQLLKGSLQRLALFIGVV